jgi:hypothetical protein
MKQIVREPLNRELLHRFTIHYVTIQRFNDSTSLEQFFRNLHRVERRAFEQLITADPEA